jgi:O26-antigen biosynthesis N-acetyl-L-fucosamine transferase
MNIVFLTDYYAPIIKSGAIIIEDLAIELSLQGNTVTIVTFSENQSSKFQDTIEDNIRVLRIKVASRKYGRLGRLWSEYRYSSLIIKNLMKLGGLPYDYIICYSPSIFYGKAIRWLKNNTKANAYLIIRDIFPEWAVDAGLLKKRILYRYFKTIENELYNAVDYIGIEALSDFDYFNKYGCFNKIEILDNWSAPIGVIESDLTSSILDLNKVNIVYGGNIGDAQDLLSLIERLDNSILDGMAILTIIGEGNQVKSIKKLIIDQNISNIVIIPPVSRNDYLSIISKADIGLVSLSKNLSSHNYPLKMIGYMQHSLPLLASVNKDNEIINLIKQKNIGLVSEAGDIETFNKNLLTIINDKNLRLSQGCNSLDLYNYRFSVKIAAKKISKHIN